MPSRYDIICTVGKEYLVKNIENDEFSYQKEFSNHGKDFDSIKIKRVDKSGYYKNLDIRFLDEKNGLAILVETKQDYSKENLDNVKNQLGAYIAYEKALNPNNDVLGIIANTNDDRILVYFNSIKDEAFLSSEVVLKSFTTYLEILKPKHINNRQEVMKSTYELNEKLLALGVKEKLRGQFVGTCLLCIKEGLTYKGLTTLQIIGGIKEILTKLLTTSINKAEKLVILDKNVLENQSIIKMNKDNFIDILSFIENKIFPYINDKSTAGQDLLNLFFTTFNKYAGKDDKNQAFTPDHIVEFMCNCIGITKHSRVLDPCCGSGAFLVRALTTALSDCDTEEEKNEVKQSHIYGIEYEDNAFGLSTTNMLIHGDGNSNVVQDSCFDRTEWIQSSNIDRVLMNPPYNAARPVCKKEYVKTWKKDTKMDPSKGFHFVYEVAKSVKTGKLAVLLPMQCAIGSGSEIKKYKQLMLQKHHLDAVFSLPSDIFHPGASASACCMIFDLGIKHEKAPIKETFFGYFKDDGFKKKKNLGRVERKDDIWKQSIEPLWLNLYRNRIEKVGLSVVRKVSANDEWLAEAYMETDYSKLTLTDFCQTIRNFLSYEIQNIPLNFDLKRIKRNKTEIKIEVNCWKYFYLENLFTIKGSKTTSLDDLLDKGNGDYPYITTQSINNGVAGFYDFYTETENVLTVDSAVLGFCSYREKAFSASDHVEILQPCRHSFNLNKYVAMFLVTVINAEQYRYCYGRKASQTKLKEAKIKLPVKHNLDGSIYYDKTTTFSGEGYVPDFEFMEDFIKALPYGNKI